MTDPNIDLLSIANSNLSLEYIELLLSYGFINLITKATRLASNASTLIDHIITNKTNYKSGVIVNDLSDHLLTFTCLDFKKKNAPLKKAFRNFSNAAIKPFKSNLSNLFWENVYSCSDTDTAFLNFWDDWSMLFNLHFPVKYVALNKNYHKSNNFMSSGLLVSRKMKLELYHKFLISRNYEDESKYKN